MDEDHEDQAVWRLGPGFQHGDHGRGGRGWVMKRRGDRGQPGCRSALSLCGGGVQRRNDLGWPELWGNLQLVGWCAGVFPLTTCGWMTFSLCAGVSVVMMVGGIGITWAPPIPHGLKPKTPGYALPPPPPPTPSPPAHFFLTHQTPGFIQHITNISHTIFSINTKT